MQPGEPEWKGILTVPNSWGITRIEYHPPFSVICKIGRAPFWGRMDITYYPGEFLLEFESFEKWVKSLALQEFTIERLAALTFDTLARVLGDIRLEVTIHAQTTVHAPVSATIERKGQHEIERFNPTSDAGSILQRGPGGE